MVIEKILKDELHREATTFQPRGGNQGRYIRTTRLRSLAARREAGMASLGGGDGHFSEYGVAVTVGYYIFVHLTMCFFVCGSICVLHLTTVATIDPL